MKLPEGMEDDKFVDVSVGGHFTIGITDSDKLIGFGNRFLKEIGLEGVEKGVRIPLPEGYKPLKIMCGNGKKQPVAIL